MELKWIATAALAVALIPAAAAAQSKTTTDSTKSRSSTTTDTVTSTSTGDVSSQTSNVTPEMLKGQQDPSIIGSPAWWKSHATADGKPISGPPKD